MIKPDKIDHNQKSTLNLKIGSERIILIFNKFLKRYMSKKMENPITVRNRRQRKGKLEEA